MRCYFHLEDGNSMIPDADGIEVADLADARNQATRAVLDVLGEEPETEGWSSWRLRVVDGAGKLLFLLPLDLRATRRIATPGKGRTLSFAADLRSWVH